MRKVKPLLDAIVLAAGRGSRFGGDKLLASWKEGVLLDGALSAAFAAPVQRVHLVVGADHDRLARAGNSFAEQSGQSARLVIVQSPDWADGLSASLKAAIAALDPNCLGAYVFLGDMPRIPPDVLGLLAQALAGGAQAAVPTFNGMLGHPALIGAGLFPRMAGLSGDRGARGLLERLGGDLALVAASNDGVLFDVDTPDALAQA